MNEPIVTVMQVPVQWVDITAANDFYPKYLPAAFDVELRIENMPWTMEQAQEHLRKQTKFRLVEVDGDE